MQYAYCLICTSNALCSIACASEAAKHVPGNQVPAPTPTEGKFALLHCVWRDVHEYLTVQYANYCCSGVDKPLF